MKTGSRMHQSPSDVRLRSRLRSVIEGDGRVPRLDVDVDVENGVVELLGVTPDEREHDSLLALVMFAARRKPVVDHLIVTRSSAQSGKGRRTNSRR